MLNIFVNLTHSVKFIITHFFHFVSLIFIHSHFFLDFAYVIARRRVANANLFVYLRKFDEATNYWKCEQLANELCKQFKICKANLLPLVYISSETFFSTRKHLQSLGFIYSEWTSDGHVKISKNVHQLLKNHYKK